MSENGFQYPKGETLNERAIRYQITISMEVHYHPHVENKKFKEYVFEFIMIFIAVTLGFFAENFREYISNRHKEKEYINSLIADIATDARNINRVVETIDYRNKGIDTFLSILMDTSAILNSNRLFKLRKNLGFPDFIYTNGTFEQLKNTGDLRLIQKVKTSNLIISYDAHARNALRDDDVLSNIISGVINATNRVLDFSAVKGWEQGLPYEKLLVPAQPIPLLAIDKRTLIEYYNTITDYKRFALGFKDELLRLKDTGTGVIDSLHHWYHLKNE
jgi:hypothetical protein